MIDSLDIDILIQTFNDLPTGVGIFKVEDTNDIKSIRYVFMNKVILYEMRKKKDEVFGKKIIEVAPEAYEHEGGLAVINTYRKVAAEGGSVNLGLVEYSNHMVAGTYECSVHHIKENYVYVMLRNVTELEKTKSKLELKNKEIGQLASVVSHDLKEPLNNVMGIVSIIEDKFKDKLDSQLMKLLGFISKATKRMKNVVIEILDNSRLGSGKEMKPIDCNEIIKDVLEDLSSRINEKNAKISIDDLPQVVGLETELRLLFQNIIGNSLKYSKDDVSPKIEISANRHHQGYTFSIMDNGIGIAAEHQQKVFEVFHRIKTVKDYEGTGIGLANCKKIVDLHSGEIWVESAEGEGSTFYFTIPDKD